MAEPDPAPPEPGADSLILRLEGFEGPLDLLLDLARREKIDLATIRILPLVDQYLAVIEGARRVRLELAAEWLVMAAWLAWLKSRLLLPAGTVEQEEAELAADVLAGRLRDLSAIRAAAAELTARPQLGQDVFARGAPEELTDIDRSRLRLDLSGLLRAYVAAARRAGSKRAWRPTKVTVFGVKDALARLGRLLGSLPDWSTLDAFLPEDLGTPMERNAALASTLVAGLELAKTGAARLRQDIAFGPIHLARAATGTPA